MGVEIPLESCCCWLSALHFRGWDILDLKLHQVVRGASSFTSIIIALVAWFCMQAHWYTKTSLNKVARVTQRNARVVGKVNDRLKDDGDNDPLRTDLMSTATTAEVDYLLRLLKESKALKRTPVAGVFMASAPQAPPSSLTVLARSMAALPETIILLHISFCCVRPFVDEHKRYDLRCHSEELGVYSLNMYFGYCEPFGPENFDLNNSLLEIFEFESYDALRKLTELDNYHGKPGESTLLAPFNESSDNRHPWTFIFGARMYQPDATENVIAKLFVHTTDFLNRNSRASREFYGLSSFDTIEVSCVTTISSKEKEE